MYFCKVRIGSFDKSQFFYGYPQATQAVSLTAFFQLFFLNPSLIQVQILALLKCTLVRFFNQTFWDFAKCCNLLNGWVQCMAIQTTVRKGVLSTKDFFTWNCTSPIYNVKYNGLFPKQCFQASLTLTSYRRTLKSNVITRNFWGKSPSCVPAKNITGHDPNLLTKSFKIVLSIPSLSLPSPSQF